MDLGSLPEDLIRECVAYWPKNTMKLVCKEWNTWFWKYLTPTVRIWPRNCKIDGYFAPEGDLDALELPEQVFQTARCVRLTKYAGRLLEHLRKRNPQKVWFPECKEVFFCVHNVFDRSKVPPWLCDTFPMLSKISGEIWQPGLVDVLGRKAAPSELRDRPIDASNLTLLCARASFHETLPEWLVLWDQTNLQCVSADVSRVVAECERTPDRRWRLQVIIKSADEWSQVDLQPVLRCVVFYEICLNMWGEKEDFARLLQELQTFANFHRNAPPMAQLPKKLLMVVRYYQDQTVEDEIASLCAATPLKVQFVDYTGW